MLIMESFVNIKTVFATDSERTVANLSKLYHSATELKDIIKSVSEQWLNAALISGKKILLKPNWVKHSSTDLDEICLRTHDQFVLSALEVILEFEPSSVVIGDAPIQSCYWDQMITPAFLASITQLQEKYNNIPIQVKDFRRVTFDPKLNKQVRERNSIANYLIFDLGKESFLEPVSRSDKRLFRVTYYNPDRLAESHRPGIHKYCITKELFDADIVISLPKIKTHQKAGITAALKNLVGLNGDKDYLPHHQLGGTGFGGDCYPGKNYLRYLSELARDAANRQQGNWQYRPWIKVSGLFWRLSFPGQEHHLGASWYGNDTTWRMVLDLNKIAIFGTNKGELAEKPQRVLYSLSDGIIGGQGNGPLKPEPLPLGIVSFTNHSGMHDVCMGTLMKFDIERIFLLKTSAKIAEKENIDMFLNGLKITLPVLQKFAIHTTPPIGWQKHLKK